MRLFRNKSAMAFALTAIIFGVLGPSNALQAGITSKVLQEAFEFTTRKFSKEVAEEGVERLASKMSALAARHSDDVVAQAFKRVGPRAGKLVSEAGEQYCDDAIRLLAKHGDAAIPLVARRSSLGLVRKFGQEAAEACMKHGSIAEPIVEQFGEAGAKALTHVSERSGRQLAMMASEGSLKPELIDVVIKYGDKCCAFLWNNKGVIAGGAALAAFISSPDEFLDGTAQLTETVITPIAESVAKPIAAAAAESFPWGMFFAFLGLAAGLSLAIWCGPYIIQSRLLSNVNKPSAPTPSPDNRR